MCEVINFPSDGIDYFGECPYCRGNDGYLNLGSHHFFICHKHKVKWYGGYDLFSDWKHQTYNDWCINGDIIKYYRDIYPLVGQAHYSKIGGGSPEMVH